MVRKESISIEYGEDALLTAGSASVVPPANSLETYSGEIQSVRKAAEGWLAKFFRLAGSTVFRKGFLALADQGLVSATNFLTMVVLGRQSKQELGEYLLGFSIILLAMCAQNAVVSAPYALFGIRLSHDKRAQYAGSALVHQLVFSLLTSVGLAIAGGLGAIGWGIGGFSTVAWFLAVVLPFVLAREFVRRLAFAHLELVTVLCLDLAAAAIQLTALWVLISANNLTAETAFAAIGLACAVSGGVAFVAIRRRFAPSRASALADLRMNWSYSKWALGAQVTILFSGYCLPWLLALLAGPEETGRYSACFSIALVMNPLLTGLNNYLSPQAIHAFRSQGITGLRRLVWGMTFWVTGLLVFVTLCLVIFGGRVLTILYGDKFAGNALPISILAFTVLTLAAGMGMENGLTALNRPAANFWAYLAGLIMTVASGVVLILCYGVPGAATAGFLGTATFTALKAIFFSRACRAEAGANV